MLDFYWYQTLKQPPLTPPDWVFTPVWIFLYILMAISLVFYIFTFSFKNKVWGYILFFTQLVLNLTWIPAFFGLKNFSLALIILILLDVLVLLTIIEFFNISKWSGKFLIPYFLWIIFATYLNIGILFLN